MMEAGGDGGHKSHHAPQSGAKVQKRDKAAGKHDKGHNPKAFAIGSVNKARRRVTRVLDRETKGHHALAVDRTPVLPPPIMIAVVGPPQVGKTTLIRSLVKHYSRQTLHEIKGAITVVAGKQRRLTFFEANNDLNCLIDVGKIADLVLLMVDGSYGFEMETFEFLNILQTHGFPRVMGVLTHLDRFKSQKTLRRAKKVRAGAGTRGGRGRGRGGRSWGHHCTVGIYICLWSGGGAGRESKRLDVLRFL